MNKITQLVQSLSQTLENSYPLDTVLKYVNGYTKRRCTKFKPLLTMICRPNLEKSIFKLMQNLTSKLHCNGFLSSRIVFSSCSWWHSHHCLFSVLWTFYPFRSIFFVYLSPGLYAPFFCTYLTLRRLFSGESSWIFHGTLWCVLLGRMTPSYLLRCLFMMFYNATCQ